MSDKAHKPPLGTNQSDPPKDGNTAAGSKDNDNSDQAKDKKSYDVDDTPPTGPWGNRGVTSPRAGTKRPPQKDSSLNVRINLDIRADIALELHAVIQGDVTIGLF